MTATRDEMISYLRVIAEYKDSIHQHEEEVKILVGSVDCDTGIFNTMWRMLDRYIDVVADKTGLNVDALNWFVFDNDCGKKCLESAWPGQDMRVIDSIEAFVDFELIDNG